MNAYEKSIAKKQARKNKPRPFADSGVIFEVTDEHGEIAVQFWHWPRCGANAKTCRKWAAWLTKAADYLDAKEKKK